MADIYNRLFGAQKPIASSSSPGDDADFPDFAGAPDPSPASISPLTPSQASAQPAFPTAGNAAAAGSASPITYTKWYRIWERASPKDFTTEAFVFLFIAILVAFHLWGTRTNRRKAKTWLSTHLPVLEKEFAVVGTNTRKAPTLEEVQASGLRKAAGDAELDVPKELLKENTNNEYITYATGRQNVAFVDFKLSFFKRYNPLVHFGESALNFLFESMPAPVERMEATMYPFDGKEASLVPPPPGKQGQELLEQRFKNSTSGYDGFVWAVVNKDIMKQLRDERYDISLTTTKDHPKLPSWATVMSESSEVTDFMLTADLIKAVGEAGEQLEYLLISDQPIDRPQKLDEEPPKKRIFLSLRLPTSPLAYTSSLPLFSLFFTLADKLSSSAHFRPEVLRKLRQTREDEMRKLRRVDEDEKAEERNVKRDKEKKEKRDRELGRLGADDQRKYLEKEREKERKKSEKKMSRKA
ncbi:MAG: hypothetical protein M1812_001133 [Candelaria pacifica]|nr:MAG: hypothetical protein M1812_001133 [Candelaria pacifica]